MADIAINPAGPRVFEVHVRDDGVETSHTVTVPEHLEGARADPERAVRVSFEFLLEREPATSILTRFSLDDIPRYFPEYERELARRLGP